MTGDSYTISAGGDPAHCEAFDYAQEWWNESPTPQGATAVVAMSGATGTNFSLVQVAQEADLSTRVSRSAESVFLGSEVSYTVAFTNNGPLWAHDVIVKITIPSQTTPLALLLDNTTDGTCTTNGQSITCSLDRMASGKESFITIRLRVGNNALSPLRVTSAVSSAIVEPNPSNNMAAAEVMIGAPRLDTPSPIAPANNANITDVLPRFSWTTVAEAITYEILLDDINPPLISMPMTVTGSNAVPPNPLQVGTYYWRVRAIGQGGRISDWSVISVFIVASPGNAAPSLNYFTTRTPTLSWGLMDWATDYEIQIDDDNDFNTLTYKSEVNSSVLYIISTPLIDGLYYWRVRARHADGEWGMWSASNTFFIRAP